MNLNPPPPKQLSLGDKERVETIVKTIESFKEEHHIWHTNAATVDLALKFLAFITEHFPQLPTPKLWPMENCSLNFAWDLPLSKLYVLCCAEADEEPYYDLMEMSNNPSHMMDERCKRIDFPESMWNTFADRINNPQFKRVNSVST